MFHSTKTLVKTRMKCDAEAAKLAFKWFEENNPFDHVFLNRIYEHCRESTVAVGRKMQLKLDGQSVTARTEVKLRHRPFNHSETIPRSSVPRSPFPRSSVPRSSFPWSSFPRSSFLPRKLTRQAFPQLA